MGSVSAQLPGYVVSSSPPTDFFVLGGNGGVNYRDDRYEEADALFERSVAAIKDHEPVSEFKVLKTDLRRDGA